MPENIVDEHAGTRDRSKLDALMEKKYGDEGGEEAPKGAGWEQKQWEEVERKAGFHDSVEDTTSEAWDVRVAIKAMKDEELD